MTKKAIITGVTGQDGSYLSELLLSKGYEVHGIKRRSSSINTDRIDHIYQGPESEGRRFILHYGDLTDSTNLISILNKVNPDEVYNLGAQSHVAVSFEMSEYTADVVGLGTLRLLEAIKSSGMLDSVKFYQASSSELYGLVQEYPQTESTPFYPRSPYAIAKLFAYWTTINFREAYDMFACNGILFNHESPRRGETFVTRKITRGLAQIAYGKSSCLTMGNLDSKRDWGHARDYVEMMWLMLQQDKPKDYVISTGKQYSVRDFILFTLKELGIEAEFKGNGVKEYAEVKSVDSNTAPAVKVGQKIIDVSDRYYRPAEVDNLLGDPTLAKKELNWEPRSTLEDMVKEMVDFEVKFLEKNNPF